MLFVNDDFALIRSCLYFFSFFFYQVMSPTKPPEYLASYNTYPHEYRVTGLTQNVVYYFLIRAFDQSPQHNEDNNQVVLTAMSTGASSPPPPPPPAGGTLGPYSGTRPSIPGTIFFVNYDLGGEGVAYHDLDAANQGGMYRTTEGVDIGSSNDASVGPGNPLFSVGWTGAGEWLKFSINVVTASVYNIGVRVASADVGGTFHFELDGVAITNTITVPNTGGWGTWATIGSQTTSALPAGSHVLTLRMDSNVASTNAVANFNYMWMDSTGAAPAPPPPAPTSAPPPPPPAGSTSGPYGGARPAIPGTIFLVNYDLGGEGVGYHDLDVANQGGKYRTTEGVDIGNSNDPSVGAGNPLFSVGWTKAGEWLKYSITVNTAAVYNIGIRVASAGVGGTFHFELDGVAITNAITVPNTGGWGMWVTIPARTISALPAGQHVLTVRMDSDSAVTNSVGNFNYMWLDV